MATVTLAVSAVSAAIQTLLSRKIHPVFAGYLCIKRESERRDQSTDLYPDFWEFFDTFFRLPGGPEGKPYYRPFWNQSLSAQKAWYQKNVAGTYAPGSAMRIGAFTQVIEIRDELYSLRRRHWDLAREHLLYQSEVPVVALSTFLYRDFGFDFGDSPSLEGLVRIFREEFGYPSSSGEQEFERLYSLESIAEDPALYFEVA